MTDIQRWLAEDNDLVKYEDGVDVLTWRVPVVKYSDHVAAVAAAEQRVDDERNKSDLNLDSVWAELHLDAVEKAREQGQRDAVSLREGDSDE